MALSFSAGAQTVTDGDTIELAGVTYVAGTVDRELLARNEYLAIENRICMAQLMVGLRRHGPPLAPERKRTTTWATFVRIQVALLARWTDFFTAGWISPGSPFIRMRRAHAHSDDVFSHR